jgi:serine/threonine protein kinase
MDHAQSSFFQPSPGAYRPSSTATGQGALQQATSSCISARLPWTTSHGARVIYAFAPSESPATVRPLPSEKSFIEIGNVRLTRIEPIKLARKKQLGGGGVYLTTWEGASAVVEDPRISIRVPGESQRELAFLREIKQLVELNHPQVTCFYGISKGCMAMEYCPGGTLRNLLDTQDITWPQKTALARDVALGLSYLHANNILHADLAADKVLLDGQGRAKLTRFGFAVKCLRDKADPHCTLPLLRLAWNDPELFRQGLFGLSSYTDIYSFGVVLWEIATRLTPRAGETQKTRLAALPADTPRCFTNLIRQAWDAAPEGRPTASLAAAILETEGTLSRTTSELCNLLRQASLATAAGWQDRFPADLPYVPSQTSLDWTLREAFPALKAIENFLAGERRVLLLLGDSSIGESSLLAQLAKSERTPLLASLSSIDHPEQGLMQTLLRQQGLNSDEIESLKNEPIALFVVGYDEITCDNNLYVTNQLDEWNAKVILICRTDRASRMQGGYEDRFLPADREKFEQLVLQRCDEQQTDRTRRLTRREIYAALLAQWYEQAQVRLRKQGLIGLDAHLDFDNFAQDLALTMFRQRTQVACYGPKRLPLGQDDREVQEAVLWGRYFDNRYHPQIPLLRAGCPLQAHGDERWSFLHKSIWEYYVARAIVSSPHLLNLRSLSEEPGIVAFLADAASQELGFKVNTSWLVGSSQGDDALAVADANAAMVLARAEIPFSVSTK